MLAKKSPSTPAVIVVSLLIAAVAGAEFHLPCGTDSECVTALNSAYQCVASVCKNQSLTVISLKSVIGIALIISVSSLANAGGIGGGAILSAVYIMIFGFSIGDSIPLSHVTIFAGALMNFFVIVSKRASNGKDQLLVDYRLVSAIAPTMLGGSMIGVLLNKLLPPVVVLAILSVYLINRTYYFYFDTKLIQEKERAEKEEERELKTFVRKDSKRIARNTLIEMTPTLSPQSSFRDNMKVAMLNRSAPDELLLEHLEQREKGLLELLRPYRTYIYLCLGSCVIVLATMLLRGGKGFNSVLGIPSCSVFSWVVLITAQLALVVLSIIAANLQAKERGDITLPSENPFQNREQASAPTFMAESFKAGVISGTLGLGGGLVLIPMLIGRKFSPETSSAVSGFIVLLTSFCTTSQFLILGAFNIETTLVIIVSSGMGSFLGSRFIYFLIQKYEKPSILMWVVFSILLASAFVLPLVGILNLISNPNSLKFSVPC